MKKNYFKKSLSLILTVLMIMSCWVFMPGEHQIEAEAALAYDMSAVNGVSKQDKSFLDRRTSSTGDYVQIKYPSTMYMDITEDLADTGYSVNLSTSFGNGDNYQLVMLPTLWGGQKYKDAGDKGTFGTADLKGQTNIVDNFDNFGIQNGNLPGYFDNYAVDGNNIVVVCSNPYNNIGTSGFNAPFIGKPTKTGTFTYDMSKANGTPTTAIYNKGGKKDGQSWARDAYEDGTPTNYTITVYDKSTLNSTINTANGYLTQTSKYTSASLSNLQTKVNEAKSVLTTREVTQSEIDAKKTAVNTAISNLVEARNFDVTYENLFSFSDWYYSDSSRRSDSNVVSDINAGTIKINNPTTDASSEYTTHSNTGAHTATAYKIDVKGGTTYKFSWNVSGGADSTEVFFMWKDSSGQAIVGLNEAGTTYVQHPSAYFTGDGHHITQFIAPDSAAMVELRFDNNTDGTNVTFSNIAVYPAERNTAVEVDSWTVRPANKSFAYGVTLSGKLDVPERNGYKFNGWYLDNKNINGKMDDGEAVTDATGMVIRTDLTMLQTYNLYSDWIPLPSDIGYDNLFSVAEWAKTGSVKPSNSSRGEVKYDVEAGTITVNTTKDGEVYTTYGSGSDQYLIYVEPKTEYIFEADMDLVTGTKGQMFVFFYNASGAGVSGSIYNGTTQTNAHIGIYPTTEGASSITFTTPDTCTKMGIRFGATEVGTEATYSNIGFYKKADYDAYAKDYAIVRQAFTVGDTANLSLNPTREGYKFNGWVDANGNKITSVAGLKASATVYATWIQQYKVTFKNYNGEVLKTQYVNPGADATAPNVDPTKVADKAAEYSFAGWDKTFTNIQSDLVVTATYTEVAHKLKKSYQSVSNCTSAATYTQRCENCEVTWDELFEDATMPALGHSYERANPSYSYVSNSSTGKTDNDEHEIKCSFCSATKWVKHTFNENPHVDKIVATCTVAGETYFLCGCSETKTVTGTTNPDNHVNTEVRDAKDAACEVPGYTGDTWCTDCNKKIATGSATEALEHVFTNYVDQNDATCDKEGTKVATCDREDCNATDTQYTGKKREHSFTNYVDQNDATCDTEGTEIATCDYDDCNATDSRSTGKKREHNFETTPTVAKNDDGTHTYTYKCAYNDCNATTTKNKNCGYGAWTTDDATTHSHSCTVCGYTPAAEAHDWSAWTTVGGSDSEKATQTRSCKVCGRVENSECKYVVTDHKDATCEAAELTTYKCSDCGHGYTEIGEGAKGHNFNGDAVSDNNGNHAFKCSNNCGAVGFGESKNTYVACSDWTYANTEAGKHTATCKTCDYVKTESCSGGEATCTAQAVCQFCNTAYGEKAAHNITGTEKYLKKATDATCIANETYYKYCINCENEFSTETYEKPDTMTAHDYTCTDDYLYIATQAKCGVNETYYAYCSNADCKKSSEDANNTYEKADTALTHNFDGSIVSTNNDGTHTITCANKNTDNWACDSTIKANCADSALSTGGEEATCTSQGYTRYQCTLCNYSWNDNYTDALGHNYTQKIYDEAHLKKAANCEHENIYYYDCSRCDKNAKDETDTDKYTTLTYLNGEVREHAFQNKVADEYLANPATCTAAAKYYTSCKYEDCGKSSEEVNGEGKGVKFSSGSPLEHKFDKKVETYPAKEANCVDNATYYYVCSLCDTKGTTTWEKENSKSGHSLTHTEAKATDCYNAGNYEYWYCATCKKYFKDNDATEAYANQNATVIAKRSHDIVKVAYEDPTCEENGTPAHEYCAYEDCKYTTKPADLSAYKATGHNFTGAYVCDTVMLYHSKKCANGCGKTGIGNDEYKVEFNEDDVAVITGGEKCAFAYNAETKNGVHTHVNTCVCGNTTEKTYSYDETFVETVAPTCTEKGYDAYKCEDCGATWKMNEVKANGHTEVITPNNDGTHKIVCSVEGCNAIIKAKEKCYGGTATCSAKAVCTACKTAYGEFGDHVFLDENWKVTTPATCVENAIETNTCSAEDCNATTTRRVANSATGHKMIADYVFEVPAGWDAPDLDENTIKEATCKADGLGIKYCQNEGCYKYETKVFTTGNEGHKWADETTEEIGNCLTGNPVYRVCENCDAKQLVETKPGLHEYKEVYRESATCTENGSVKLVCNLCSDVEYVDSISYDFSVDSITIDNLTIDLADLKVKFHKWGENIIDKEATCGVSGKAHRICSVCSAEEALTIRPTGKHELRNNKGVPATCDRAGSSDYKSCINCSYMEASTVIPALGHADTDGNGKCDNCNDNMNELKADGCICHKDNGFMKFIYKILSFFWKLFKINKTCDCGAVHY